MGKKGKRKSPRTYYNRAGRKNKHHIKPKVFGGTREPSNLILLDENRHAAYHLIFHNMSFIEAARLFSQNLQYEERNALQSDTRGWRLWRKRREDY